MNLDKKMETFQLPNYKGAAFRSNNPELFCKKCVLKNFAKFTGKHLWQRLFFNTFIFFISS